MRILYLEGDWFKTERISILGGSLVLVDAVKMKSLIALIAETRATAAWRHASPPEVALSPNSILYSRVNKLLKRCIFTKHSGLAT